MGEHKRPQARHSAYASGLKRELEQGVLLGGVMAGLYGAYAVVLFAVRGSAPFERNATTLGGALAAYAVSGIGGGLLYGLLYPLRRSLPGQMLVGVAIATLAFLCIEIARGGASGGPRHVLEDAAILGVMFGVAGTFAMRRI